MKRWPTLAQVGLLALLVLGLGYWTWQRYRSPSVPVYEGKTLAQWLDELYDADYGTSDAAADALVRIGPDAVPLLLDARASSDVRLHRRAVAVLVRIGAPAAPGLVEALEKKPEEARVETALVRMGPAAAPALVEALKDETKGKEAAHVLGLMGSRGAAAVPGLIGVLRDRQAPAAVREEAADALGKIGEPVADVVSALTAALKDDKEKVRYQAAEALRWMGPLAKEAMPALVAALKDEDARTAEKACLALARLGDALAIRPLMEALQGPRGSVADQAALALWQIGPAAKDVVPGLIALLKKPPSESRRVRTLLLWLGPIAVPGLADALHDNEATVRQSAAEILGLLGPVARAAVPALAGALQDRMPTVALSAALALTQIDPTRARDAVPRLADALDDAAAAEALADMGSEARAAVPALIAALKHREKAVRDSARHALGRIGPPAVPALIDALKSPSEGIDVLAAEALAVVLPRPKEAVPALRDALQRDRTHAAVYARTLGEIGPPARAAIKDLDSLLSDAAARVEAAVALVRIDPGQTDRPMSALIEEVKAADEKRARTAIDALGRLGPAARPAVSALAARLKDRELTEAVLAALRAIGPEARDAVPALLALLREPGRDIALPVAEVLVRIGPAAIPRVAGLLQDPNVAFRRFAVSVLAEFGPAAREALPPLLYSLEDPDSLVRAGAAHVMEVIGPSARDAVPALIAGLSLPQDQIRFACAVALGHIGKDAREARAALRECLLDPFNQTRYAAALALGRIDPKYIEALPALRDALHDGDPDVRLAAVDSLARIDKASVPKYAPVLLGVSNKPYYLNVRLRAVAGTIELAPDQAKKAMPLLMAELNDVDPAIRLHAATLIERIEPEAQTFTIVLALTAGLRDRDPLGRKLLLQGLAELGSKAYEAVPALVRVLQDDMPALRQEAAKALRAIDPRTATRLGV
jgi:HEAT repeat protein